MTPLDLTLFALLLLVAGGAGCALVLGALAVVSLYRQEEPSE